MEQLTIKVYLWGLLVGLLKWDNEAGRSRFSFSEEYLDSHLEISPVLYPKAKVRRREFFGNRNLEGLPEFLADSLPDDWGNTLFDKWTSDHQIPSNDARALYKLSFIGSRGMGAFEFIPSVPQDDTDNESIVVEDLYRQAMYILKDREEVQLTAAEHKTLSKIISLGTSIGGKHAKGLIAINPEGDIRSGQISLPDEYKYYVLKFNEERDVPSCEVEKVFYDMALEAGIPMMPSQLYPVEGVNHFLTERFDRKPGGEKVFSQTLRALSSGGKDYMNLFWLCETLHIPAIQREHLFRQMVFNFFAGVSDDHSRNFSFLMDKDGNWSLAPAYDVMFTSNTWKDSSAHVHSLAVWGKNSHLTAEDFVDFGEDLEITNCKSIIKEVSDSIRTFPEKCKTYDISSRWRVMIWGVIHGFLPK